jgi:hypothetical protein
LGFFRIALRSRRDRTSSTWRCALVTLIVFKGRTPNDERAF